LPPPEEVFLLLPGGRRFRFLSPCRFRAPFSWAGISCRVAEVGRGRLEEALRFLREQGKHRVFLSPSLRRLAGRPPWSLFSLRVAVEASFLLLPLPAGEARGMVVGAWLEAAVVLGQKVGQLFLGGSSPRLESVARALYREWGLPVQIVGDIKRGLSASDIIIAAEEGEGEVRPEAVLWDLSSGGRWGGGRGFREAFFRFPLRFPGAPPGLLPSWAAEPFAGKVSLELRGVSGGGRVISLDTGEAGYLEYGAPKVEREMEEKEEVILTREGLRKLEEELEYLKTIKRREVAERIRLAREFGDLAENAEYDEAKNEQAFLESRILTLEKTLRQARVVVEEELEPDRVNVGSRVVLEDLDSGEEFFYTVVGPSEADPSSSRISYRSPVGRALMGRMPGEVVEVRLPYGMARYRVKAVSR